MNVRIFWVRAMKCMCAQTRHQFILSSERVFWGMEFEPMLTPREKSPLPETFPRGGSNPRRCGQQAQTLPTSYSGPCCSVSISGPCKSFLLFVTSSEILQGEINLAAEWVNCKIRIYRPFNVTIIINIFIWATSLTLILTAWAGQQYVCN